MRSQTSPVQIHYSRVAIAFCLGLLLLCLPFSIGQETPGATSDVPAGDYVLQFVTIGKKNSRKKEGVASQTLSFTVTKDQTCETGGNVCAE